MPELTFDSESHTYRLDGQPISNVTRVLKAEGFINGDFYTEWGRERGRIVHKATHFLDMGTLDWDTVDPRIEGYLRADEAFKQATGFEVIISERPMCSFIYRYGTTLDRFGLLNGELADIDFKTGKAEPWVALQTAAHVIAIKECYPEYADKHIRRFALELRENGTYGLIEYKDRRDRDIWLSALTVHNWKNNNRR